VKATERFFLDGVTCRYDGRGLPVANLSVGGLFAATERPPLRGQTVSLELDLGDNTRHPMLATVTWVNDGHDPRAPELPAGFGVRITRIDFPSKLAIVHALKRAGDGGQRTRA
jgi:hypothetical protein